MMKTRRFWMVLVAGAALVGCGGGGGGGGKVQPQRSLAQELGPSPYRSPSAVIANSQSSANAAVAEVLAGHADARVAAQFGSAPFPPHIDLADLPSGRSTEQCPQGGQVTLTAPSRPQVGAQYDVDFANCTVEGVNLDGSMFIEVTEYVNQSDFAFALEAGTLALRSGGQTFPPFPGLVGCHSSGASGCYFSLNRRGWSSASTSNGNIHIYYAARWESGTVRVHLSGLDPVERVGSATVTGGNSTVISVTPTGAAGVYEVSISGPNGTGTYSVSR